MISGWSPSLLLDEAELLDEQAEILRDLARLDDWDLSLAVAGNEGRREEKRAVLKAQLLAVRRRLAEIGAAA